jgi:spoIIIJ-associated protein
MNTDRLQTIAQRFLTESGIATECRFEYDDRLNILFCELVTPHGRSLTARNGEGMHALNMIVRKVLEKEFGEETLPETSLIVDIYGQEKKRIEALRTMAHMMAERARYFKSSIDVDPMSPYDRRIVHEYVSKMPDLETESVGEGMKRHIVIRYKAEQKETF